MRYLWLLAVALSALCLLSGSSSAASATTGDIEGTVTNQYGDPLRGVLVQLEKNGSVVGSQTTDTDGNFTFLGLALGNYSIRVVCNSVQTTVNITVKANKIAIANIILPVDTAPTDDDDTDEKETGSALFSIFVIALLFFIGLIIVGIVIAYNYSKITSDRLMEHETRIRIFEHIQKEPGQHLRKIGADLDLPLGVLTHHIGKLEKEEVIKSRIDGKFKRYYPWDAKIENKQWLSDVQNDLLRMIKGRPGISPNDLVACSGSSRSNAYYHIAELEGKGLIRVDRMEKRHKCYLVQDT